MKFKYGDELFTFFGEQMLCLSYLAKIDDLRISAEDDENQYVLYRNHCYKTKLEALEGMNNYMIELASEILESH